MAKKATKKSSVLDALDVLPDKTKPRKSSWYDRLQTCEPEFFAEMTSIIDRHLKGDAGIRRKLPTTTMLCKFLANLIAEKGEQVGWVTVGFFIRQRREVLHV